MARRVRGRQGLQEADIHEGVRGGGTVTHALVVVRPAPVPEQVSYVAYLRVSWLRGYHGLQLARYRGERVYRNLGRLVFMLQEEFKVVPPIQLYRAGSAALQRFRSLPLHDLFGSDPPPVPPLRRPADLHIASPADGDSEPDHGGNDHPEDDAQE